MKKYFVLLLSIAFIFALSLQVMAEEMLHYTFDGEDSLTVVTNTLKSGGGAKIEEGVLSLDSTYGLKLGAVGNTFSVSAQVKIESTGGTNTIFFKDMDNVGNKWTGVISNGKKPAFWTHGSSHRWETVATGTANLGEWTHITYVENNATGTLYVNGEMVGSGSVESGAGNLYLGATYWTADAVTGEIDNVKLFNTALSADEVMAVYEECVDFENLIKLPSEVISDIELLEKIASKSVTWTSSDENIIDTNGKVTRGYTDAKVTLTASIDGEVIGEFEITVLKKPTEENSDVILSYVFDEANDGAIIHDVSGNGNHAAAYNSLSVTKDGAHFDGIDDYIEMTDGILYGHDEITITVSIKPMAAQLHTAVYTFGNTSETGYMFLNPSRPSTNLLRFAATKTSYDKEQEIASIPGIRTGEWATVTVVISGKYVSMYVDGELVMDGEIGIEVSDLGQTANNFIAKSLYEADPYFAGYMKEFTIYNYAMRESKVKSLYSKSIEYAESEEEEEYIESVSFDNGTKVTLNTQNRLDVKIGVIVLDENNEVIEYIIANPEEEISLTEEGTVCVFAFNEEDNIPGRIYVKGRGDIFDYETTSEGVKITTGTNLSGGMVIVAGYDTTGALTGVSFKITDLEAGVGEELFGDFNNSVTFKMFYWENLVAMVPIE